ncbi:conserved hypothetical protein [uncultured Stenotrophomonas sp.]|uniref:Uncharacterized protein n=1 Tax=uncultured Stenotrophomonas sp. TaxID=165438 RepID=A0A1Y5Q6E3_9GAMM|nr:conserved hypothetical protein [uncultured Stenotrophomonas sp.]
MSAAEQEIEVLTIAAMARDAEWLNADACAFLLGMTTPAGKINRRGFLERIAVRESFPRPMRLGTQKRWRREDVARWADDEAKISRAA